MSEESEPSTPKEVFKVFDKLSESDIKELFDFQQKCFDSAEPMCAPEHKEPEMTINDKIEEWLSEADELMQNHNRIIETSAHKLLKQCQSELAKREGANKELLGALGKIASGTEDDLPPFRAMPRQNMQVIAQTALAKHKVES